VTSKRISPDDGTLFPVLVVTHWMVGVTENV